MAETAIKVTGLKEATKAIYGYSQQLGDKVVKGSLSVGARLIARVARRLAPRKTGLLRKSGITVRNSKIHRGRSSKDLIGVYLTIAQKKKSDPAYRTKNDPYYGRFQETGWNTRGKLNPLRYSSKIKGYTHRAIDSSRKTQRGKTDVPGKWFIDRAFEQNKERAVEAIRQSAIAASEVLARKVGL